jgi:hypothetical protein
MTTHLRRSTLSVLGALALSAGLDSGAQPSDAAVAPRSPAAAIEIDRTAFVIDIATERRVLDANIRSELARRSAAEREREPKLAAAGARPPG